MQELHGVIRTEYPEPTSLKREALLFDRFHVLFLDEIISSDYDHWLKTDLEFLKDQGIASHVPLEAQTVIPEKLDAANRAYHDALWAERRLAGGQGAPKGSLGLSVSDLVVRQVATKLGDGTATNEVVPICRSDLPRNLKRNDVGSENQRNVIRIAMEEFPFPDELSAWQDIFDFREESHDKQWNFRRFLRTLATKNQSNAEIRDDLEWSINEFKKAMRSRRLKILNGAITACLIPALDLFVNSSGNHLVSIATGVLAAYRLKVELMEGELKAPGRECAYVLDARTRFGGGAG